MEVPVKNNILRILKETLMAIKKNDLKSVKDLSNRTIHDASTFQDSFSIGTAVLLYSISKILERVKTKREWEICYRKIEKHVKEAIGFLNKDDEEGVEKGFKDLNLELTKLDPRLKVHIKEVFEKAKINKASRIYEHGISIGRTAEILGITPWELMDYSGKTGISEKGVTKSVKERLRKARELFR